jgi:hypothetical protein
MLDQLLSQSRADAQSSAALTEAQTITHEMKGTGGSLGFPGVAAAASALDDDLKLLARQERVSQSQLQTTKELYMRLRKTASQATAQKSTLFDADFSAPASSSSPGALSRVVT